MRITTAAAFQKSVSNLQERQRKLQDAQEHIGAQKRVLRASDDPVAAARAERARGQIASSDAQQRSLQASRNAMTQAESTLGNAGELLTDAYTALMSAGNGAFDDANRATVAQTLQNLRDQLLMLANREDGSGNYVFGGQGASTPPFVMDGSGKVSFKGDRGEQATAGAEALPLTLDGAAAWVNAADGNGFFKTTNTNSTTAYSDGGRVTDPKTFFDQTSPPPDYKVQFSTASGSLTYTVFKDGAAMPDATDKPWAGGSTAKAVAFDGMSLSIGGLPADGDVFEVRLSQPRHNVFETLDKAIQELRTPGRTSAQLSQTIQDGLAGISRSSDVLSALRSRVGEALVHIDQAEERNGTAKLQAQTVRSEAEDLDVVAALADMQLQSTNYDVALKTYSMVQKLSIFNHIG